MTNRNIKNTMYLYFLGGFVEGEGSNSVSISINKNFKYGINIQPVFNVTQHKNGINILYSLDRKSTRLNSSHSGESRMPSSA